MCGKDKAYSLVQLGKRLEAQEPQEVARNYLLAADLLVREAVEHPQEEQEYLDVARKIFLKAKELKNKSLGKKNSSKKKKSLLKTLVD